MGRIVKSVSVAALLISLCFSEATAESLLDYHDYHEMADALKVLSRQANVIVEDLGPSTLFAVEPPVTVPILALRITGSERPRDNGDSRPAILFDGGIHAREWLTAESMIELAQFLASQSLVPESRVARALEQVDVWIIPMSNPSGRLIDDQAKGDPRKCYRADGPNAGGWRGNGDTRFGKYGIDVARNFSHDWQKANNDPSQKHWHGAAPFQSLEATALRQFVQNHLISMAVHNHSNSQLIATVWDESDRSGLVMRKRAVETWQAGANKLLERLKIDPDDVNLTFGQGRMGTSAGQFTAWLATESDQTGLPDERTNRAIKSFLIELPFNNPKYNNYYGGIFEYQRRDGANSFHPSGSLTRELIREAYIPMAMYFIEQASSPCCATSPNSGTPEVDGHQSSDLCLIGAKICTEIDAPGVIVSKPAQSGTGRNSKTIQPAKDYVVAGKHHLVCVVQNSTSLPATGTLKLSVDRRRRNGQWENAKQLQDLISLQPLASQQVDVPVPFRTGYEYAISWEVQSSEDKLVVNNRKIFRFNAVSRIPR